MGVPVISRQLWNRCVISWRYVGGREQVTSRAEVRCDGAIGREKALGMSWGLESPHAVFSLASRLVRIFCAVIQIPVLTMFHAGHNLPLGRAIAVELIRDDHPRHVCQPLQQLAEEPLRRLLVPPALHEDIEDITVLVDGPPQIVALAMDGQKDLIQVPLVSRSGTPTAQLIGIGLPELSAPIAHRFIGQDDATCGHQLFDIPVAQAKAKVQPHTVADDLGREPMALIQIGWWWCIHAASMAYGWSWASGKVNLTTPLCILRGHRPRDEQPGRGEPGQALGYQLSACGGDQWPTGGLLRGARS